ncbi:MAG: YgjV family protein [Clostridia bacterium]|nr:YgjV family protein [Clostridia bacterium]
MTFIDILAQIVGFFAIAMNILSVQFNTHFKIMFFKSLGSFLFCVQYLMLGAFTGLVMDFVGVIRNFVFAHNVKKGRSNKWWIVLFCIITAGAGITTIILTWNKTLTVLSRWTSNPSGLMALAIFISVISVTAKLISTIGYGFKSPHAIRMINLPTFAMWISYNVIVCSIAGIVSDSMSIGSIIVAEIRYRKKPETENEISNNSPNNSTECLSNDDATTRIIDAN